MMYSKEEKIKDLEKLSHYLRASSLKTILDAGNGHIGGNMSSVELLTALYFGGYLKINPQNSKEPNRDRVLVRGHLGPLRYSIFSLLDYINVEELKSYRKLGSRLQGHEDMFEVPGVDITPSGSLGMLLSYGVGSAIANKNKGLDSNTIVFLGDGEEQEGNISEAARHASTLNLNNLICILDKNKKQLSRPTIDSDGKSDIKQIWSGYGWDILEIKDGNNIQEILTVYDKIRNITKPTLIIANTTKGLGVKGALSHFSGYHTLSSVPDKSVVKESYEELKKDAITYDEAKKIVNKLINRPEKTLDRKIDYNIEDIFNIRTKTSGINLEDAQDAYMKELKNRILASNYDNLYFITPDLLRSDVVKEVGFDKFTHYIDTGIREQHAIAMAHGISVENPEARIHICYGDAFAYRALDQINAAATGKSNIIIVGENAGIFQGKNGKTHQSVGQPEALMAIPELEFYEPADSVDLYNVLSELFIRNKGVNYVRFHRGTVNIERNINDINNIGAYFIHKSDYESKLILIVSGFMAENAVKAAKKLEIEYNIPTNVINVVNQKRFSEFAPELILNNAQIITIYNGNPDILTKNIAQSILSDPYIPRPKQLNSLGYINGTSGDVSDLIKHYGFDEEGIKNFALRRIKK